MCGDEHLLLSLSGKEGHDIFDRRIVKLRFDTRSRRWTLVRLRQCDTGLSQAPCTGRSDGKACKRSFLCLRESMEAQISVCILKLRVVRQINADRCDLRNGTRDNAAGAKRCCAAQPCIEVVFHEQESAVHILAERLRLHTFGGVENQKLPLGCVQTCASLNQRHLLHAVIGRTLAERGRNFQPSFTAPPATEHALCQVCGLKVRGICADICGQADTRKPPGRFLRGKAVTVGCLNAVECRKCMYSFG